MTKLSLVRSTGGERRAEIMIEHYDVAQNLQGQTITIDGSATIESTPEFCTRLLQLLLIERQGEEVSLRMCSGEIAEMFRAAAAHLYLQDRLVIQERTAGVKVVTVSMTDLTVSRVRALSARHQDTKTDTINRAVALYECFDEMSRTSGIFTRTPDGNLEQLRITT